MLADKKKFPSINATAFQHPLDIQAINALNKLKGFDLICQKMMEYGYEKVKYIDLVANHVKVSPRQCPKIYEIFRDAVEALGVSEPALFIGQSPEFKAYTSGSERPFIVVNSTLVEMLTEDELHVVLGHELGHIKCRHVIYIMVSEFVRDFADLIAGATFGLGNLLSSGLELGLFNWYRKAEISCDRAALLVSQNLDACLRVQMKMAGGSGIIADQMNTEEFVLQADLYSELDSETFSKIYKFLMTKYQTHPYSVLRAKDIKVWAEGDQYQNILNGEYPRSEQPSGKDEINVETPIDPSTTITDVVKESAQKMMKSGIKSLFGKS